MIRVGATFKRFFKSFLSPCSVCHEMADHSENTNRDYDGAIRQYKEALQVHPEDEVKDEDILLILISIGNSLFS